MELELSETAQKLLYHLTEKKHKQADERVLYGGGNPDAEPPEGLVDDAVAELRAAGLDLTVSEGASRRMIVLNGHEAS